MLCESQKRSIETLEMIRQVFGEESMSHTRVFEWQVQVQGETGEEQSQENAHNFFTSRGTFIKNLS
jgi:hypothetical protein